MKEEIEPVQAISPLSSPKKKAETTLLDTDKMAASSSILTGAEKDLEEEELLEKVESLGRKKGEVSERKIPKRTREKESTAEGKDKKGRNRIEATGIRYGDKVIHNMMINVKEKSKFGEEGRR